MKARRHAWDFGYERPHGPAPDVTGAPADSVVAAHDLAGLDAAKRALAGGDAPLEVTPLVARAPLFWARVRGSSPLSAEDLAARLGAAGVRYRYVTPAGAPSMALAPALDLLAAPAARADGWRARRGRPTQGGPTRSGDWFLHGGGGGVNVDRRVCGTGAGTRLAVIDDEIADLDHVELESLVTIGIDAAPATSGHSALMVSWATSARRSSGERFVGVAPDATVRMYCIPKPGIDVCSLPVAIASAAFAGADVIVCATYLGGSATSPLLDDALEVAVHLGRRGRGTLVMLPTGRETSSPGDSLHASLSLGLDDPASDARVHCVAPGGREGGGSCGKAPRAGSGPSRTAAPPCGGSRRATTSSTRSACGTGCSTPSRAAPRRSRPGSRCSCWPKTPDSGCPSSTRSSRGRSSGPRPRLKACRLPILRISSPSVTTGTGTTPRRATAGSTRPPRA